MSARWCLFGAIEKPRGTSLFIFRECGNDCDAERIIAAGYAAIRTPKHRTRFVARAMPNPG